MSEKNRLSQRHEPKILEDLLRVSKESGVSQVALVAACIKGLSTTWDEEHELTFPFRVVPTSLLQTLRSQSPDPDHIKLKTAS